MTLLKTLGLSFAIVYSTAVGLAVTKCQAKKEVSEQIQYNNNQMWDRPLHGPYARKKEYCINPIGGPYLPRSTDKKINFCELEKENNIHYLPLKNK